ncbi:MAG: hypothetical protein M3Z25_05095 [Actinomycetota bacterium]|nr:hypothetical protein [Actinomycetota bacterium]
MELQQSPNTSPGTADTPARGRADIPLICRLVPIATWTLTAAVIAGGAIGIAIALASTWWLAIGSVLLVPVVVIGLVSAIRIGGELALALQHMSHDVTRIAERLPQLADTVDDLASQMPRQLPQMADTADDVFSHVPGLGILRKLFDR